MTLTNLRYRASGMYGIGKVPALTGRPYAGFDVSSGLRAWRYTGGSYAETLAERLDLSIDGVLNDFVVVNLHAPLVVAFREQDTGGVYKIHVWNVSTNGLVTIDRSTGSLHGGAAYQVAPMLRHHDGHGFFYWVEYESEEHQFWLMRGSMSGGVEQLTDEAEGQLDNPTEFVNDFGGFLSIEDGAVFIPNWGGGSPLQSGYIHLPLDGSAPSRVVDTDWLPDITVGVQEWETGHGTARGPSLLLYDGAGATRPIYKWTQEGGLVTIIGAAHGLGDLDVENYHESLGGEVIVYANDGGTRQVARVPGAGIADPPTGELTWTEIEAGPTGSHPEWLVALD